MIVGVGVINKMPTCINDILLSIYFTVFQSGEIGHFIQDTY